MIRETLRTVMPDGVTLLTDVARPNDSASRPVPLLLARTPYLLGGRLTLKLMGRDVERPGAMAEMFELQTDVSVERAVAAGFAVGVQACRGTDRSDGTFRFYRDEASDGVATRRALAALPWCDGSVLTFGHSYVTTTQFTAALADADGVAAMTPWVAPSTYDDDLAMRGGVLLEGPGYEWARLRVTDGRVRDGLPEVPDDVLPMDVFESAPLLRELGIAEFADRLAEAHPAGAHLAEWVRHPLRDEYWEGLAYSEASLRGLDVPALHVSGWYDVFQGGTLRNYRLMRQGVASEGQRLVIGPWTHINRTGDLGGLVLPRAKPVDAGLDVLQLDFWRASLGDAAAAARLPAGRARVYLLGLNRWVDLPDWPVPDAEPTRWALGRDADAGAGVLLPEPGAAAGEASTGFVHDPADPVPTCGGPMLLGLPHNAGPLDQQEVERRADVVTFTGPTLDAPLAVVGPVRLRVWVSADAPDAHLHATLADVAPDGRSTILTDGVLRLSGRRGLDRRDPLTPGEPEEVEIDLWATGNVFLPGHAIRLDLAGSNWPRYSVSDPAGGRPVEITLHHDAGHRSVLTLPVLPSAAVGL